MNRTLVVCTTAFVGIAIWLVVEHQARQKQSREIVALQQRLDQMTERVTEANGKMFNLVTKMRQLQVQRTDQADELAHLRDEVKILSLQSNEIEALRGEVYRADGDGGTQSVEPSATAGKTTPSNPSRLQILEAYYWTQNRALDVTEQLRRRITGDNLEVIAGNDMGGDPEYGQVKTLTVLYKFDGMMMTNEVREGEVMALPGE